MSKRVRTLVRVEGIVQGVGFRPFVFSLATRLGLAGRVGNDVAGVFAEVEGPAAAVSQFLLSLEQEAPPLARIERITTENLRINGSSGFMIAPSEPGGQRSTLVSPDTAARGYASTTRRGPRCPASRWRRRPACCGRARCSPSRAWAAITWQWTRRTRPPPRS